MGIRKPIFLIDGGQSIQVVTDTLVKFINGAKRSLHIAIFDFRLGDPATVRRITGALKAKAAAGVDVKIAYDHRNAPKFGPGDDPAPHGTHVFLHGHFAGTSVKLQPVGWTEVHFEGIAGSKLMHNKYVIRDGHSVDAAVLMGSANFTDDAWTHQENNILILESAALSAFYETDFQELWAGGKVAGTGVNDFGKVTRDGLNLDVAFSPGEGRRIDHEIANLILDARESIHIASMVITSDAILQALSQVLRAGRVTVRGIFDGPEMHSSKSQMRSAVKIAEIDLLEKHFIAKHSTPYDTKHPEGLHDFMHNKTIVVDDALITGSHNFSHSAEHNAENALLIRDPALAKAYRDYIGKLVTKYSVEDLVTTRGRRSVKSTMSLTASGGKGGAKTRKA